MRFNRFNEDNAYRATKKLLQLANVKVTSQTLGKTLSHQTDFPSLGAISDTLHEFNVPNLGTRLDADRLLEIPLPALAHLSLSGGLFAPIRAVQNNEVEWWHFQRGWQKSPTVVFEQFWEGVTLLIEPQENSGEANYAQKHSEERFGNLRLPFVGVTGLLILGLVFCLKNVACFDTIFWVTKTIGAILSGVLLWYSIDTQNSLLQKVCRINSQSDCQNILSSPAAKVFGWLSWAEVGFFYFTSGLLYLCFGQSPKDLLLLNGLAFLYIFWSIYHQAVVAKQWCVLCLCVQVILLLEFIFSCYYYQENNVFGFPSLVYGALSVFIPITVWVYLKPFFGKAQAFEGVERTLYQIKNNPIYIQSLVQQKRTLPPFFEGMNIPNFGNVNAENVLILVLNPVCSSCQRAYSQAQGFAKRGDVAIYIILAGSLNETDESGQIVRQILSLPDSDAMKLALEKGFRSASKNYASWLRNAALPVETVIGKEQNTLHLRWLELANVQEAPAIFLNHSEIPKYYQISELNKFLI